MVNLAIVGIGRWGRILVDAVEGVSDSVRFTHGATGTRAKAEAYCAEKGIALLDSFEAVLAEPSVDGIVLATPHSQHAAQIKAAAAAGKHVFCEKPVTLTKASIEDAMAAVRAAGIVFAAGHNRRFLPAMQRLREAVKGGELGTIINIEGNMSGHVGARYTNDMWRVDSTESPAGGLAGSGIHVIDAMIHLLGPIEAVMADSRRLVHEIEFDDTTTMLFRFAEGPSGYLTAMTATASIFRIQVFGSKGWAELMGEDLLIELPVTGPRVATTYEPVSTERLQLEAFAHSITSGEPYPISLDDVIAGVAAFEAVAKSAAARRWVDV
ncbi:MAG: Gfo/Idh/MocA family oxidoreductase [Pseudomonadota bacterium]